MKITRLETLHVRPRWLFLKVHTDDGIVGLGEPIVEGRAQTVETAVHELGRWLVGQDPRQIEDIWQKAYRGTFYRGGPVLTSALSGVEQALWDILGKSLGVPVWRLLGGRVRDRIRLYGGISDTTTDYAGLGRDLKAQGFTAYKYCPMGAMRAVETPEVIGTIVEKVARLREVAGPGIDLALDFHGRTSPAMAIKLARLLEPFEPMFIEEPVLPGDTAALKLVARSTTIPIATGERLYTRWQFIDVINELAAAVIQPDPCHAGGIFETRKIAALAETRNIALAPHCPLGPIALAACLQIDACTPNFLCQEFNTLGEGYLVNPFRLEDGHLRVPEGPGLGIELDDEAVAARIFDGDWETPQLALKDGSFAEW